MNDIQSGALIDDRVKEEKEKDFLFAETVGSPDPVIWEEKPKSEWRRFPIFNQDGSGSCVAQTAAKLMGIMYWLDNDEYVHFSATHLYQRRKNRPNGGMLGVDALSIMQNGVTLEELVPSQDMSDREMDETLIADYKREVGRVFKTGGFVTLPTADIDTVASVIQRTSKGVMTWFYFNLDEWGSVPNIQDTELSAYAQKTCRHSVAAVDFTLYKGKKALIIEDSWGFGAGMGGQRIITEDFFKVRNIFSAYARNFTFVETTEKVSVNPFEKDLEFTTVVSCDIETVRLQEELKRRGFFPDMECTGYYGAITKRAVGKFQERYGIVSNNEEGYGRFGPRTRSTLNSLINL